MSRLEMWEPLGILVAHDVVLLEKYDPSSGQ
jgi:hypothetical protein